MFTPTTANTILSFRPGISAGSCCRCPHLDGSNRLRPADGHLHQVAEYLAAGMDAHLAKPVQLDKLYATLMAVRSGRPLVETDANAA